MLKIDTLQSYLRVVGVSVGLFQFNFRIENQKLIHLTQPVLHT